MHTRFRKIAITVPALLLWIMIHGLSGQSDMDYLLRLVRPLEEDTSQVSLLNKISWQYGATLPDQGIIYGNKALTLAEKLHWKIGMVHSLRTLGYNYKSKSDYPAALNYYFKAIELSESIGYEKGRAAVNNNIAVVYKNLTDYPMAQAYYLKALALHENAQDTNGMALVYANLGQMYLGQSDEKRSLEYNHKSLALYEAIHHKEGIAEAKANLGLYYQTMEENDTALLFYSEALTLNNELDNRKEAARVMRNMGEVYNQQKEFVKSLEHTLPALKSYATFQDKRGVSRSYAILGSTYLSLAKNGADSVVEELSGGSRAYALQKAIMYTDSAIYFARAIGALKFVFEGYLQKSKIQEQLKDLAGAYESMNLYMITKDSVFNEENDRKLTQQAMQFEFDKKEAVAESVLQRQKALRNIFIGGFAGVLIFAVVFFLQRNRIRKAKNKAEESERVKQQFLANMSHEIRTPMNAIMGITNLVLDTPLEPKQRQYLTSVHKASENLLYVINDILDLSKLETGKIDLEEIHFSIRELLEQVMATIYFRAKEKSLELILQVEDQVPEFLIGDPMRLSQVLINLTGNAIKFTDKGSVVISVSLKMANQTLHVAVEDTGIGIPADKLDRIFESFSQAHASDSRKYGGTGLGLTISKQFIELMGGRLEVESVVGSGSTFSFELPLLAGSAEQAYSKSREDEIDGTILNGLRILLVDDHEDNRLVCRETLQARAHLEIVEAANGLEAINFLSEQEFDILLTDVQMPVMDGYELTRNIRANKFGVRNAAIPIIAITASVIRSDLDKCKEAGMNDYVPKPFKVQQLIHAIATQVGRKIEYIKVAHSLSRVTPHVEEGQPDLSYLREFCGDDPIKMRKYIDIFQKMIPASIELLTIGLEDEDAAAIASRLHADKPKFIMMGMLDARELTEHIEAEFRLSGEKITPSAIVKVMALIAACEKAKKYFEENQVI